MHAVLVFMVRMMQLSLEAKHLISGNSEDHQHRCKSKTSKKKFRKALCYSRKLLVSPDVIPSTAQEKHRHSRKQTVQASLLH